MIAIILASDWQCHNNVPKITETVVHFRRC